MITTPRVKQEINLKMFRDPNESYDIKYLQL